MKDLRRGLLNKRGSQMVEAAIVLPVVILIAVLLLRLFVFYLEILVTGIKEHEIAIEASSSFKGQTFGSYENERELVFAKGGLLGVDVSKRIKTEAIMCNEDALIRAGEIIENK